jgi:hypothetical protein
VEISIIGGRKMTEEVIAVYWSRLKPVQRSTYKRECPFCEDGLFLVGRERGMLELEEIDGCISCGQKVRYLDIEKMRERDWAS